MYGPEHIWHTHILQAQLTSVVFFSLVLDLGLHIYLLTPQINKG